MMSGPRSRGYVLALLTVILAFNSVDRITLGVVLQGIKTDLSLSDTQLGLLSGIAFALFYSFMGIPIARWADKGNRVVVIATTTLMWSMAVAVTGIAHSFAQLLLIRVAVGVGEAGCVPPATSLISDYFSRAERPRAIGIYALGGALSFVVGFFAAGWLNQQFGWRGTFALVAMPGLILAALSGLTLVEPRRHKGILGARLAGAPRLAKEPNAPSLREVVGVLWRTRSFPYLLLCMSVIYFFGYGILQWQPTFFMRSYGLTSQQVGLWLALTYGIGGTLGTLLGGEISARLAPNDETKQLRMIGCALVIASLAASAAYLVQDPFISLTLIGIYVLGVYILNGPLLAIVQTLVPANMRAMAMAIVYLVANLLGLGLGPLATGILSDIMAERLGPESLRYSLLALSPGYLLGAYAALVGSRRVMADIEGRITAFQE